MVFVIQVTLLGVIAALEETVPLAAFLILTLNAASVAATTALYLTPTITTFMVSLAPIPAGVSVILKSSIFPLVTSPLYEVTSSGGTSSTRV